MKHVSNMRHSTESDNHIILEKGVSLQMVLRPVQALIPRTPLADTTRIVWIICTVNLNQPRIVGGIELSCRKGESPLTRHATPKPAVAMLTFAALNPLFAQAYKVKIPYSSGSSERDSNPIIRKTQPVFLEPLLKLTIVSE